jgi:hypothetical protein
MGTLEQRQLKVVQGVLGRADATQAKTQVIAELPLLNAAINSLINLSYSIK